MCLSPGRYARRFCRQACGPGGTLPWALLHLVAMMPSSGSTYVVRIFVLCVCLCSVLSKHVHLRCALQACLGACFYGSAHQVCLCLVQVCLFLCVGRRSVRAPECRCSSVGLAAWRQRLRLSALLRRSTRARTTASVWPRDKHGQGRGGVCTGKAEEACVAHGRTAAGARARDSTLDTLPRCRGSAPRAVLRGSRAARRRSASWPGSARASLCLSDSSTAVLDFYG